MKVIKIKKFLYSMFIVKGIVVIQSIKNKQNIKYINKK